MVYGGFDAFLERMKENSMNDNKLPHPQVKSEGVLDLGRKKIKCFVLEDGRRVFGQEEFNELADFLLLEEAKEIKWF